MERHISAQNFLDIFGITREVVLFPGNSPLEISGNANQNVWWKEKCPLYNLLNARVSSVP